MRKRIVILLMCGILGVNGSVWAGPVADAFGSKEMREDETFDITTEEVVSFAETGAGLKIEWSDLWKPIVGMCVEGTSSETFVAVFEPEDNVNYEELFCYITPHSESMLSSPEFQDILIGTVTQNDRKSAKDVNETLISSEKAPSHFYSYRIDSTVYFNISMNTGKAIIDFIYQYPVLMKDKANMDAFLAMMDSMSFID